MAFIVVRQASQSNWEQSLPAPSGVVYLWYHWGYLSNQPWLLSRYRGFTSGSTFFLVLLCFFLTKLYWASNVSCNLKCSTNWQPKYPLKLEWFAQSFRCQNSQSHCFSTIIVEQQYKACKQYSGSYFPYWRPKGYEEKQQKTENGVWDTTVLLQRSGPSPLRWKNVAVCTLIFWKHSEFSIFCSLFCSNLFNIFLDFPREIPVCNGTAIH